MRQFLQFGIYSIFSDLRLNDKALLYKVCDGITDTLKAEGINVNKIRESQYKTQLLILFKEIFKFKSLTGWLEKLVQTMCKDSTPQYVDQLFYDYRNKLSTILLKG